MPDQDDLLKKYIPEQEIDAWATLIAVLMNNRKIDVEKFYLDFNFIKDHIGQIDE